MDKHAIQLVDLTVDEISFKRLLWGDDKDYPHDFSLTVSRSDYDPEEKTISVRLEMAVSPNHDDDGNPDRPFEMRIMIAGHFEVDDAAFPIDKVHHWAENNAPVILIPYMREHAFSVSLRGGVTPVLFPLIQVPTFKVIQNH
jgi:preprotein translocase subunit SecB